MIKKTILTLYTLLIVCMGLATVIEKTKGKDYVHETVYGSWWFIALWGLLAGISMVFIVQKRVHRRWAVMLLHVSFVVMLAGTLVTHLTAEGGTIHLRVGKAVDSFVDDSQRVLPLPYNMTLSSFEIQTYPGTDAVMDYRCSIDIEHSDKTREQISVSMNNIGKVAGYRFYQSSYDDDGQGTHLLVAHDPYGIAITYTGYILLLISLLWTMFSKQTRIRQLYHIATRPLILLAFLCVGNMDIFAAGERSASLETTSVSNEIAHDFGKIVILYNGRLCPINTAATEFVTKLTGKASWNGYSADEIFVGWMIYYTEWEQQKLIRVKSSDVQKMLGIDSQWTSVRDFYTPTGAYKLSGKANDATLTDATRKAVRETDEKIQVISMFYNSEMLRMFPLKDSQHPSSNTQHPSPHHPRTEHIEKLPLRGMGGSSLTWHTPGSTELPRGIPEPEFQFINHAMDHLVQAILVNDISGAQQMIAKIRLYQKEKAGTLLPSSTMIEAEVFYNRLTSARWVVFLCLTISLLLCILLLSTNVQHPSPNTQQSPRTGHIKELPLRGLGGFHLRGQGNFPTLFIIAMTLYLTILFVLRWIVSRHIPMSNGYETMLFMAWATLLLTLITMRIMPVLKAFGPVVSSFCMLVATLANGSPQITNLMPVLQSPLLSIHVVMVMISYALLAIITLLAVQGLILARSRKYNQLERTTALSQFLLYPAITTLSIGIFVGAVWANVSWGTYWSWDPKETWALITLMIYAIPLHLSPITTTHHNTKHIRKLSHRGQEGFGGTMSKYHMYILLSFLTVLMTYFGVNYFLSGMHSYA